MCWLNAEKTLIRCLILGNSAQNGYCRMVDGDKNNCEENNDKNNEINKISDYFFLLPLPELPRPVVKVDDGSTILGDGKDDKLCKLMQTNSKNNLGKKCEIKFMQKQN